MEIILFLSFILYLITLIDCVSIVDFSLDNHPIENLAIIKCSIDLDRYSSDVDEINILLYFNDINFYNIVYNDNYYKKYILKKIDYFSVDDHKSNKTHTIIKDIENLTYGNFTCHVSVELKTVDEESFKPGLTAEKTIFSLIGPFSDTIKIGDIKNIESNENLANYKNYKYESYPNDDPIKIDELLAEIKEKKSKTELKIKYPYFLPYYTRLNLETIFDRVKQLEIKQNNLLPKIENLTNILSDVSQELNEKKEIKNIQRILNRLDFSIKELKKLNIVHLGDVDKDLSKDSNVTIEVLPSLRNLKRKVNSFKQ